MITAPHVTRFNAQVSAPPKIPYKHMVYVCHIVYMVFVNTLGMFYLPIALRITVNKAYNELVVVAAVDKKAKSKTKPHNAISKPRRLQ